MKKVNFIGSTIVFGITFGLINWYEELRGTLNITVVDQAMFQDMTTNLALVVGGLAAVLFGIISYKVDCCEENVLLQEFISSQLSRSEKDKLEQLDDYQKNCFYLVYKENFSKDMKDQFNDFVNVSRLKVKHTKTVKKIASLIVCLLIVFTLHPMYQDYVEAKEVYDEQLAQEEVIRQQQEAEYNTIIEDQILYYDGFPPIQLISNNTFRKGMVEDYINQCVRTQPQILLDQCSIIHLCSSECFVEQCNLNDVGMDANGLGTTYAFATSDDNSIYVQIPKDDDGEEYITDYDKMTVTHELSHLYDYNHWVSDTYTWQALYSQYASSISEYAMTDESECFAEAAELYVNSPEELQQRSMEVFNFINSYYQMY